jgi:hypothetical protein
MSPSNHDLIYRARRAWFRTQAIANAVYQDPGNESDVYEHDGVLYVVLQNINGILAVYQLSGTRVRKVDSWPDAVQVAATGESA